MQDIVFLETPQMYAGLFLFLAIALLLYRRLSPDSATILTVLLGTLFLPVFLLKIAPGVPAIDRNRSVFLACGLCLFLLRPRFVLGFRFRWADLPMALFVTSPLLSSLVNGLGWYDGLSSSYQRMCAIGLGYLLGRLLLSSPANVRRVGLAWVVGGFLYLPLCLIELVLSPQLHVWTYGYQQHYFIQQVRAGGFRPMVFMRHSLEVGVFMSSATVLAIWYWMTHTYRSNEERLGRPLIGLLSLTTLLTKTLGPLFLGIISMFSVTFSRRLPYRWLAIALTFAPMAYVTVRVSQIIPDRLIMDTAYELVSQERAESLQVRLQNESEILRRIAKSPFFGLGSWQGSNPNPRSEEPDQKGILFDSAWGIVSLTNGFWGLFWFYVALTYPLARFVVRVPPDLWWRHYYAAAAGAFAVCWINIANTTMNDHQTALFYLFLGALSGFPLEEPPPKEEEYEEYDEEEELVEDEESLSPASTAPA